MKRIILLGLLLFSIGDLFSQVVVSDDSTYVSGSSNVLFEVYSAGGNKGILIPRLTTAQRTAIATTGADEGLVVYDTDTQSFWVWDGTQWKELGDKQTLSYNSSTGELSISNGNSVTLPTTSGGDNWGSQVVVTDGTTLSGDGTSANPLSVVGDLTDDQQLSLSGNILSLDDGGSVDLSQFMDNTDDQQLSLSGSILSLEDGGSVDLSGINTDDQTLSISGNILSIENGNSVDLSSMVTSNAWSLTGNSGTTAGTNFVGTTDDVPLMFKINNLQAGLLSNDNAFFGKEAGINNNDGIDNVLVGYRAGYYMTSGDGNVAVGDDALYNYGYVGSGTHPGGNYNVAIGKYAMFNPYQGDKNIGIGYFALSMLNSGDENTFVGASADLDGTTPSVSQCSAFGAYSSIKDGATYATVIGYRAYTDQSNALILGQTTNDGNPNNATGNTNVGINTIHPETGANLTLGPMDGSDEGGQITFYGAGSYGTWRLDVFDMDFRLFSYDENYDNTFQIFNFASGRVTNLTLDGSGTATAWNETSDKRLKSNVRELGYGLNTVLKLKPVAYKMHAVDKFEGGQPVWGKSWDDIGLIAQELYKIVPEVVHKPKDESKELWAVDYAKLTPILIKAIQEQQAEIEKLKKQNEQILKELERLRNNN